MRKSILTSLVLFCFSSFCFNPLVGQIPKPDDNLQSPNVASLGLFDKAHVSLFTGQVNVQVPLYKLSQKETSVPINLNYNTTGFRPDVHPGWVGMGWSLSAGGMVSRTVKGYPDEMYINGAPLMGYYYSYGILASPNNWTSSAYGQSIAGFNKPDTEPDEFSFSFDGYSGNFYLDQTRNWRVKCDKPIKVKLYGNMLSKPVITPGPSNSLYPSFGGFEITTEIGTRYCFGGTTDAIEYAVPFFARNGSWTANSWALTKIISPSGEEINFSYIRGDYIQQMSMSVFTTLKFDVRGNSFFDAPCGGTSSHPNFNDRYNGTLITPVYLSTITGIHNNLFL